MDAIQSFIPDEAGQAEPVGDASLQQRQLNDVLRRVENMNAGPHAASAIVAS
jgi:hypothetical protein